MERKWTVLHGRQCFGRRGVQFESAYDTASHDPHRYGVDDGFDGNSYEAREAKRMATSNCYQRRYHDKANRQGDGRVDAQVVRGELCHLVGDPIRGVAHRQKHHAQVIAEKDWQRETEIGPRIFTFVFGRGGFGRLFHGL